MNRSAIKTRVLILVPHYLPFVNGGGPIVSVANLIGRLADEFEFRIVTSDRDLGASRQAPGVEVGSWVPLGKAAVYRAAPRRIRPRLIARLTRDARTQVLYINGLFHARFSIAPALASRLGVIQGGKLVIAPRGELYPGALGLHPARKRAFLEIASRLRFYRDVRWHATNSQEVEQIRHAFPNDSRDIVVAPNLSGTPAQTVPAYPQKNPNALRLIFISRIAEKKGLHLAISCLADIDQEVELDVFGPIEDGNYWSRCLKAVESLPANIRVTHHGAIDHAAIRDRLAKSHVFILPTLGENYGHAIVEALSAGRPVIISDQTPWKDLEECSAGFALPLDRDAFSRSVRFFGAMDQSEFKIAAQAALSYAHRIHLQVDGSAQYRELFRSSHATSLQGHKRRKSA